METKHTKHTREYAANIAENMQVGMTKDDITFFTIGYMKAIEETAAPELLEACIIALKAFNGEYAHWTHKPVSKKECAERAKRELQEAIQKATK